MSLSILRFHQILRPNKPFRLSLRCSPIHLIQRYQCKNENFCFFPVVGRPYANIICVILVIIRMKVLAEKRRELSQTIVSLIGSLRTEKGCLRFDFCQSMEDENELCILEEWDTREDLDRHLKSERFRVLRGAMNLLREPYEMTLHEVSAGRKRTLARSQPAV